jgi:hypothetical protein
MAVVIRDEDIERKLEDERRRRLGNRGTRARVARDIVRDYFAQQAERESRRPDPKSPEPSAA